MAYTFRTQSITGDALNLAAAPYAKLNPLNGNLPLAAATQYTAAEAFARYGVDSALTGTPTNIDFVLEFPILTLNLLDPKTGAFRSSADQTASCVGAPGANPCLEIIKALGGGPQAGQHHHRLPDAARCWSGLCAAGRLPPWLGGGRGQMAAARRRHGSQGLCHGGHRRDQAGVSARTAASTPSALRATSASPTPT